MNVTNKVDDKLAEISPLRSLHCCMKRKKKTFMQQKTGEKERELKKEFLLVGIE